MGSGRDRKSFAAVPPTIHDVAAAAGVSAATASRALSGRRQVTPAMAEKVLAAAASLGYRPNAVAQALRRQTTATVGMVVPSIANPFFTTVVEAVEHVLQRSGRELLLCDSQYDPGIEARRLQALAERQVDGLIVSPCDMHLSTAALRQTAQRVPLVQLDRHVEDSVADWVGLDDGAALTLAVEHVAAAGARTAAFVGSTLTNSSAGLRLAAFHAAAHRAGLTVAVEHVLLGEFSVAWGRDAALTLLRAGRLPDAAVCANDQIALGLLSQLRAQGVAVPGQVSVTGLDDIPFAEVFDPPLTTVRQPYLQMAEESVRLLDAADDRAGRTPQRIAIAPTLVTRGSTRSPS